MKEQYIEIKKRENVKEWLHTMTTILFTITGLTALVFVPPIIMIIFAIDVIVVFHYMLEWTYNRGYTTVERHVVRTVE